MIMNTPVTNAVLRLKKELQAYPGCELVAVTKKQPLNLILEAYEAGVRHIGESYYQEAKLRLPCLPKDLKRHFIGRLQSNKIDSIVALFDCIQSVDSLIKLQQIDKAAEKISKKIEVFIQIQLIEESQKSGISPLRLKELIAGSTALKSTTITGLMLLPSNNRDAAATRQQFHTMAQIFEELKNTYEKHPHLELRYLSMGMTKDYPLALAEGSNMIRIGRGIFPI